MKHKLLFLWGMIFAYANIVYAANTLKVQEIQVAPGGSVTLNIELNNTSSNLMGWQCDIVLPNGLSMALKSNGKPAATLGSRFSTTEHTISTNVLSNGAYRFIATSLEGEAIPGTLGTLFSVTLQADPSLTVGSTFTGRIQNIEMNTQDNQKLTLNDVLFPISVSANKYNLIYILDDQVYNSYVLEFGAAISPELEPFKEGYTFSGWSEMPPTMPAYDITITGSFTINKYKLTYEVDGEEYKSFEVEYDAMITPEAEPTKEGYTFSGWSKIPETMPANDVTVVGSFTTNKYELIYLVDGKEYKSFEVEYGATITPEGEPTKEGHTFSGWSEIPSTMTAHDVTVTGCFTINKYKLTYMVDGAEYKSYEAEFGATITPEAEPIKEGHTFSMWSEIPETMPAKDVTITGMFIVNTYLLSYIVDGDTLKTDSVSYGTSLVAEANPEKEGYTFCGWSDIPEMMPAKDVTITGTFNINTYKLTYQIEGLEYKAIEVEYGAAITPEAIPKKEGYTFSGWSEIPSTMPAHDVTVTGCFTINKYKLTYMVDGAEYKSYEAEFGATITPEAEPIKEGHTFSMWSEIPETMPAKDVTITGTFIVNKYLLSYIVDGDTLKTDSVSYGTSLIAEAIPAKEGYTFSGWSDIPEMMPAKDVTITGMFNINTYKLTYQIEGLEYKAIEVEYGAAITPEAIPIKEGYTFSGWSDIPKTMPAKNVMVTGTFMVNTYLLSYIVDGDTLKTDSVSYGTSLVPETIIEKEGYTFSGWSDIPETMPAKDVTVTGTFIINKYTLTYQLDGEEYKSYIVEYGTDITPEAVPTKEGYTFSGWSEIPETMPAKDVMVTGIFTINKYKLIYMLNGEEYKVYELEYGASITPEAALDKEGYTFSGWSEIPETMPANDVTVIGIFATNKHKLTYMVDGQEYKTDVVEYGTAIMPEAEPTKEGYTFSGWSWIPKKMPDEDVTVIGTFTINTYKLTYMIDDKVYKVEEYKYGSAITPEAIPEGDYVSFVWKDVPETMPANDVTVYADYQTGIDDVLLARGIKYIYAPNGKRIEKLQKGLNIVVMNDGTVRKVVVR